MMRVSEVLRETKETEVFVKVNLDGEGKAEVDTGISFFDHLLTSLATHSLIDITVRARGDLKHHIIEDVALCLGDALKKALGEGKKIKRFGYALVPMDCSLALSALDISRRPYPKIDLKLEREQIEDMPSEDINHFLVSLASSLGANIHIQVQYGENDHHKVEAAFKALALSLRQALSLDKRRKGFPSSKGVI